jgi:hypothetical protein
LFDNSKITIVHDIIEEILSYFRYPQGIGKRCISNNTLVGLSNIWLSEKQEVQQKVNISAKEKIIDQKHTFVHVFVQCYVELNFLGFVNLIKILAGSRLWLKCLVLFKC